MPLHFWMAPAIPPQMPRIATLVECVSKAIEVSRQVVPVTSLPETICWGSAEERVARAARMMARKCIFERRNGGTVAKFIYVYVSENNIYGEEKIRSTNDGKECDGVKTGKWNSNSERKAFWLSSSLNTSQDSLRIGRPTRNVVPWQSNAYTVAPIPSHMNLPSLFLIEHVFAVSTELGAFRGELRHPRLQVCDASS